jgi:hypothetical protein
LSKKLTNLQQIAAKYAIKMKGIRLDKLQTKTIKSIKRCFTLVLQVNLIAASDRTQKIDLD